MNSGTGALEVALEALGAGCGDEVLVPGFMWISTIAAVVRCRAIPVLVDSDDTMNMDPADVVRKVNDRTRVVLPVHMAGEPARIGPLMEVVRAINADRSTRGIAPLMVLEDVAQAIGGHATGTPGSIVPTEPEGIHRLGTFGVAAIFSLQLNKNITSGEGGVIVTRNPEINRRVLAIHDVGFLRDTRGTGNVEDRPDQLLVWGQGRRFTEVQAALARVQLRRLDGILKEMKDTRNRLAALLADMPGITIRPHADTSNGDSGGFLMFRIPWGNPPRTESEMMQLGRDVRDDLRSRGLPAFYCHDYEVHVYYNIPQLKHRVGFAGGTCPWDCPRNQGRNSLEPGYGRGTLPRLDADFVRTVGIVMTSQMTGDHEKLIGDILAEVYDSLIAP